MTLAFAQQIETVQFQVFDQVAPLDRYLDLDGYLFQWSATIGISRPSWA